MKTCLTHEGEEAHCFKGYGLSSGVGTGDYQKVKVPSQIDINGNDVLFIEQRMTGFS